MIKSQISSKKTKKSTTTTKVEIGAAEPPEEQQKVADRPTPCTVLAVVLTLFILIILIIALGQLGLHDKSAFEWDREAMKKPPRARLSAPCQTEECVHYSSELFEMMSPTTDPCTDFHQHVCEGFNPEKRRLERLLRLIDTSKHPEHPKAVSVVRKMLTKCAVEQKTLGDGWKRKLLPTHLPFPLLYTNWTSLVHASEAHLNFAPRSPKASEALESGKPSETLTSLLIHISQYTPEDLTLFGIQPSQDSEFSLFVVKPQSRALTEYEFRNVLEILMPRGSVISLEDMERQLQEVLQLQEELKEIGFEAKPEVVKLSEVRESMPIIDWKRLIKSWHQKPLTQKVFGFNTTYYSKVSETISKFPRETLYNLVLLRWSHTFLRYKLSPNLEETCLQQVATTIPGKIVLYGSAEVNSEKLMDRMLQTIRSHLKTSLTRLKWMDEQGIEEARKKFSRTEFCFGFTGEERIDEMSLASPDYIGILREVLSWQTKNMFKSIADNKESVFLNSEVFYSVEKNKITISRALLHYPFISSHLPNYTNFATIASRILPHLIHVFDERGRFYDSNGHQIDWWNTETERYFRVIVECFEGMMQNVLGVSVSIGLNAYNSTSEPYAMLPGRENLTDTAMFFYSFVKTMCTSEPDKVNNALASVPQFIDAFNCRGSSKMNHKTKCRLAT